MRDRLIARYKLAGFIPDKFWKTQRDGLKSILLSPLDEPYDVVRAVEDKLIPFFGLFKDALERYGLNRHALSTVEMRVDVLLNVLKRVGDSYGAFERVLNSTPYPSTGPTDEVVQHIAIQLKEHFTEQLPILGKALRVTWTVPSGSMQTLAERLVKKATPAEIQALEASRNQDFSNAVLTVKYGFFNRINLDGLAKKLVKKEKIDRDYLKWFDFLREVLLANYTQEGLAKGFDEFSIGNLKAVILDPNVSLHEASGYAKRLIEARALLKQKGFEKLWYGVLFVTSREYRQLDPASLAAYKDYGYDTLESQAGTYHSGENIVKITAPPNGDLTRVIIHEMGHRYWYKFMTPGQRARFNDLVQTNSSKQVRDYPSGPTDQEGFPKPVTPVSDYGKSTIEESFAEAFEHYVNEQDMNRDQLESFRSVLARTVPMDKSSVMRFTEFLERQLEELASKHDGPFGRKVLGQWPYEIRGVDGEMISTYVRFETVPTRDTSYILDGGVGFLRGTPIVVVQLNGTLDADALRKGAESHVIKVQLYNMLIHEFTHVADKYTRGVGRGGDELSEDELRNNPAAYYNNPAELHAFMQEVVDQVSQRFIHYEKLEKRFGQKALGMLLNMSDTWGKVSPYWTERNKQKVLKSVYQALEDWKQSKTATGRVLARYRGALTKTIDVSWVENLRKDFLTLMKNLPRVTNYQTGAKLRDGFKFFSKNFKKWVFDEFLNPRKEENNSTFEGIRKSAWDFYIEMSMPLGYPDDGYNTEEMLFARYEGEKRTWEQRIRAKAQKFWKDLKDTLAYVKDQKAEVVVPDIDRLVIEGFQAEVRGFDPTADWQQQSLAKIKEALRQYRRKASARLPWLIQKQLPLVLNFQSKLNEGGLYQNDHITIAMGALAGEPPEWGVHILAHEMGHHLYRHLSGAAQKFWESAILQDYGPIDLRELLGAWPDSWTWASDFVDKMALRDPVLALQVDVISRGENGSKTYDKREDFQLALDGGKTKLDAPKHPITGYAGKNPEESFCEAIGRLVGYGPATVLPQVRQWLDIVIPGEIKTASVIHFSMHPSMATAANLVRRYKEAGEGGAPGVGTGTAPHQLLAALRRVFPGKPEYNVQLGSEAPHLFSYKADARFSIDIDGLKMLIRNGLMRMRVNNPGHITLYFAGADLTPAPAPAPQRPTAHDITGPALYAEAAKLPKSARFGSGVFLGPLLARFGTTPQAVSRDLIRLHQDDQITLSRADLVEAMDPAMVKASEIQGPGSVRFHLLRPLGE
jgi:hypothetical protein